MCQQQLGELQGGYQGIINAGATELIAISSDTQYGISQHIQRNSPDYVMLSDSGLDAINSYNVLNPADGFLAHPTAFIINEDGKVAWKDSGERFGHRTTSSQIINALNEL